MASAVLRKLEKVCQNARDRGNGRELAGNLEELACELAESRQWRQVVDVRSELLDTLRSISAAKLDMARCHRFIGEAHLELREVEASLKHVRSYLKLCQDESDLEKQRAFTTLGRVYVAKHDIEGTPGALDKAIQFYNSALLLALQFEKDKRLGVEEARLMRGRLLYNLALASQRMRNEKNVLKYLERAVYTLRQLSNSKFDRESKTDLYNALCELSECRCRLQDSTGAVEAARGALSVARDTKNSGRRGESHLLLGMAFLVGARWKDARQTLNHARVYAKNMDEIKRDCLLNSLKCAIRLEKWNGCLSNGEGNTDHLLEKIGDTLAKVGLHRSAIEAYRKIEPPFANKCKRYAAVCGSIAETHADLAEHGEAQKWYLEEVKYRNEDEYEDLCSVFLSLVNCALKTKNSDGVLEFGRKATEYAAKCQKGYLKRNTRERLKEAYAEIGLDSNIEALEIKLPLHAEGSESDEGTENDDVESSSRHSESDSSSVNISDLSLDAPSDEPESERSGIRGLRTSARRHGPEKRNGLGESLLQQECVKGNLVMVNKLIAQGFDVNSTDNGGLSCLHDAANNGFLEIAKALVEAGAMVNKEGKDSSHRIVPLHSAAAGGNYLIVSYLLDKGANAKAMTIRGQTAFDVLEPTDTQDEVYMSIRDRLEAADMEVRHLKPMVRRRYQHITAKSPFVHRDDDGGEPVVIEDDLVRDTSSRNNKKKQRRLDDVVVRSKRTRTDDGDENDRNDRNYTNSNWDRVVGADTATSSSDLRSQPQDSNSRYRQRTPPALPASKAKKNKKMKQPTIVSAIRYMSDDSNDASSDCSRSTFREDFDHTLMCSTPTKSKRPTTSTAIAAIEESMIDVNALDSTDIVDRGEITLIERRNASLSSGVSSITERSTGSTGANFATTPVHLVRVRVEDRLLSIPLPREFSSLTIAYLEQQAAERYMLIEGTKPVVNIALEDGALLCSSDPIVCVQGIPVLKGVVVSWNVPPLEERFKVKMGEKSSDKKLLHRCQVATALGKLDLDHTRVPSELMVVLKHEVHLHTLNLSFVHLDPNALLSLAEVLAKLKNLKVLRLAGCNLRGKQLCDLLGKFGSTELSELDLSYNYFDQFFANLLSNTLPKILTSLRKVRMVSCGIQGLALTDALKQFSLGCIDISCNALGEHGFESIMSLLEKPGLKELDISNCLGEWTGQDLLSVLYNCGHLQVLKINGLVLTSDIPCLDNSLCNNLLQLHVKGSPDIFGSNLTMLENALGRVIHS